MEPRLSTKAGFKGGINLSNFYNDDINDNNLKAGLNAGLFAKLPVSKGFSIQPELLYSNKGSKTKYDNVLMGKGEVRTNLHYVELPVLGVFNIVPNFNIHMGPYISYLAAVNIRDMESDGSSDEIADLDADNFNRFDYGVAGGVGIDLQNVSLGARYTIGLNEIGKSGSVSGEAFKGIKNTNLSFYVGVGF
ncbi:hypothetical protein OI18_00765 [Flavihumibacter solisilvae]|uniref:Outer membrane protein beta-barrel domain-containing protein n=1 Tax=Flavihumibacter solisilvae TaxID=1349421 RepID=A0A0C1LAI1_9BACT|nr:hypothetical protein OI18_00765 [Flavihumibacter solisilvae]